jgi:hypothetical protein
MVIRIKHHVKHISIVIKKRMSAATIYTKYVGKV